MKTIIQQRLADAVTMDLPEVIERECRLPKIPNKAYAIIGMRRTGKTYFLYQTMKRCLEQGVDRSRLVYFNFEDERLSDMTLNDLHWISDEYFVMFPENRSDKVHFFFDEIQQVERWEKFVRRLMDTENVQVYISGSSAKMLSREIASSMRGRAVEAAIYPYSYREFLKAQNIDAPRSLQKINKQIRSLLENQLQKYLTGGGFPEAQGLTSPDRHLLLQGYVNTVLFRDIVDRFNVTNIGVLKMLIRHLLRNPGSPFTVNKFYNQLKSQGIRVAKTTLHEYLDHLQDAFLVRTIHIYTQSERKRMVNPIKPYVIDTGLAASYSLMREPDIGHLLENCVFMELCRRQARTAYLNTTSGYEIDFVTDSPNGTVEAIQVSVDISDPITRERECRALYDAGSAMPDAHLLLINISEESTIKTESGTIRIIPAWKWLLKS
jgi:predicted AAA+ superfamily ATPase